MGRRSAAKVERGQEAPHLVKLPSFWVPQELVDRVHATCDAFASSLGMRQSQSEVLRTAISLGLDALDRKHARRGSRRRTPR